MKGFLKSMYATLLLLVLACPVVVLAEDSMDLFPLDPGTKMFNLYYNDVSVENGAKTDTLGIRLTYVFPPTVKN